MQTRCRSSLFLLIPFFLAGIPAGAQTKENKSATKASAPVVLEGRMVTGYKSICDLEKPALSPESITLAAGTKLTVAGCAEWDQKEVFALVLKVTNATAERKTFKLPLPADITIATAKGIQRGAALYFPWGYTSGFCTIEQGGLETEVGPNASVEFLYLLPKTTLALVAHVPGYGRLPIEKSK